MAEHTPPTAPTRPAADAPQAAHARSASGSAAQRGDLDIADRVVQKVATLAAGEVPGVVATGSGIDHLLGRQYPSADATIAGTRTSIRVDLAVAWPYPLAQVAAQVREHVRTRVSDLVGLSVDAVDVTVSTVVHPTQPHTRRVQ